MKINTSIPFISVLLTAMVLLAGCSGDDIPAAEQQGNGQSGEVIVLGVKEVATPVTRAQHTGSMDFTQLETTGFGVYGYEGTADYNSSSTAFNLFTANTPVTFVSGGTAPTTSLDIPGSWKYTETSSGLKEWDSEKKYTFFAYAPYMSAGETGSGINTISTGNGDPTINYTVATDPAESVDLLWGVRSDDGTTNPASTNNGKPWMNVQQGDTHSAVLFTFYHALCALGLHAQVMVDQANDTDDLGDLSQLGTIGSSGGCKVTLKSITITPATTAFHQSGVLNLNNTTAHTPNWGSTSGTIASLCLDSGLEDDGEGGTRPNGHGTIATALLDPNTSDFSAANPSNTSVMTNSSVPGITESANSQAIIKDDNLFMLIPQAAQNYTINIEYYITYKTTGESSFHREAKTGTATISNLTLSAGVKYYLNLVFGLTTFKVTVDAVDWEESTTPVTIATELGTSAGHSLAKRGK